MQRNESALVSKKLCSALVSFFIRAPSVWERCVRQIVCSLHKGAVWQLSLEDDDLPRTLWVVKQMSHDYVLRLVWFITILAEEVSKVDTNSLRK
jgi:hypothetical protein